MGGPGKSAFLQATLPYDASLVRVRPQGNSSSLQSTALSRNFLTQDLDLQGVIAVNANLPEVHVKGGKADSTTLLWGTGNYFSVVAFHDPVLLGLYPAVSPAAANVYTASGNVSDMSYDGSLYTTCGANVLSTGVHMASFGSYDGVHSVCLSPLKFVSTSGGGYGEEFYAFTHGGERRLRYFWVDASAAKPASISVTITCVAPALFGTDTSFITLVRVMQDQVVAEAQEVLPPCLAGGTSAVTLGTNYSGYYAVLLDGGLHGATAVSQKLDYSVAIVLTQSTALCTRQLLNYHAMGASNQIERCQVNGSAMLVRNTQALAGQGSMVYALSVGDENTCFSEYTSDVARKVVSSNSLSRYEGSWAEGIYGFIKPNRTFVSRDLFRERPGAVFENLNDPVNHDGMNIFCIAVVTSTSFQPKATLTSCVAFEFTTRSQMFVKGYSPLTGEDLGRLQATLQLQHPFTENPLHWAAFLDAIKGGAKKVMEWAPKVVGGVAKGVGLASDIAKLISAV